FVSRDDRELSETVAQQNRPGVHIFRRIEIFYLRRDLDAVLAGPFEFDGSDRRLSLTGGRPERIRAHAGTGYCSQAGNDNLVTLHWLFVLARYDRSNDR